MEANYDLRALDTSAAEQRLNETLIGHGHVVVSGVPGVFGHGRDYEAVLDGVARYISKLAAAESPTFLRFPPVLSRECFEASEFLESFPHLAGTISNFVGSERELVSMLDSIRKGVDWSSFQKLTDLVLTPAACYSVYPLCAGRLPEGGRTFDVAAYCFRREPSGDPARMQSFRMQECVRVGDPRTVLEWRDLWKERISGMLGELGIEAKLDLASDPFFGRGGRLLAVNQREKALKFEALFPLTSAERPTPLVSFNYHQDHFGRTFRIRDEAGELAHTACLGFGMDRIVLALLVTHGMVISRWPRSVRAKLLEA